MTRMVEIGIVVPKEMKILIPQCLFEELEEKVKEENLSIVITEALSEELKKVRFRMDLAKVSTKTACSNSWPSDRNDTTSRTGFCSE